MHNATHPLVSHATNILKNLSNVRKFLDFCRLSSMISVIVCIAIPAPFLFLRPPVAFCTGIEWLECFENVFRLSLMLQLNLFPVYHALCWLVVAIASLSTSDNFCKFFHFNHLLYLSHGIFIPNIDCKPLHAFIWGEDIAFNPFSVNLCASTLIGCHTFYCVVMSRVILKCCKPCIVFHFALLSLSVINMKCLTLIAQLGYIYLSFMHTSQSICHWNFRYYNAMVRYSFMLFLSSKEHVLSFSFMTFWIFAILRVFRTVFQDWPNRCWYQSMHCEIL